MTTRIAAVLARLPWTPRQLAHAYTVGLLAGVAAVLVLAAVQRAWNRDGATVLLALVAVFLIGEAARAARWLITDLRRVRGGVAYSRDRQPDFVPEEATMTDAVSPPIVEARQLYDDLGNHIRICDWINKHGGKVTIPAVEPCLYVETPAGAKRADIGDWVARDSAGSFHVRSTLAPTGAEA